MVKERKGSKDKKKEEITVKRNKDRMVANVNKEDQMDKNLNINPNGKRVQVEASKGAKKRRITKIALEDQIDTEAETDTSFIEGNHMI